MRAGCYTMKNEEKSGVDWADDGGCAEEFVEAKSAADYGSACFDYDDARVAEADAAHRVERR
jgi:hypothetical protein